MIDFMPGKTWKKELTDYKKKNLKKKEIIREIQGIVEYFEDQWFACFAQVYPLNEINELDARLILIEQGGIRDNSL